MEVAGRLASEAVDVGRPQGDSVELGYALVLRAHVHARGGEWQAAQGLFQEALELRERMNNPSGVVAVHNCLAQLFIDQGCSGAAKSHLDRALAVLPRADTQYEALCLIGLAAQWAAGTGQPEVAVLLDVAQINLFGQAGFKFRSEAWESEHLTRARLALSSDLVEHLVQAGRALTYDQAMQRIRALLSAGSD